MPFGIDCSGFVQMVYKLCGIALLRDSSQQATQGDIVNLLSEAYPGDLAFFDKLQDGQQTIKLTSLLLPPRTFGKTWSSTAISGASLDLQYVQTPPFSSSCLVLIFSFLSRSIDDI
jgi:hypothetical protein